MALPVVLGLVVTLIYNLADTFFIAQTKDTALIAGVYVCSPVFTTLMAFGNIYGQGGSSLLNVFLVKNNLEGNQASQLLLLLYCDCNRCLSCNFNDGILLPSTHSLGYR